MRTCTRCLTTHSLPTPKIQEQNDFIDIEIIRPEVGLNTINTEIRTITNDYERLRTIADDYGRLSLEKQKILLYLLDHQSINRSVASPLIEAKSSKTSKILAQMVEKDKLIIRQGIGPSTYYTLHENIASNLQK